MDAGWEWGLCDYTPDERIPGPAESMGRRLSIKPQRPTINMIRRMTTAESFTAGQECLGRGGVVPVGTDRGIFTARVLEGKTRMVIASMGYGSGLSYCPCPYDDRGACAHVVAALLYASENFDRLIREENDIEQRAEELLGKLSDSQMRELLLDEMNRDEGLRRRLLYKFGDALTRPNIRADLDEVYYRMGDAGHYGGSVNFEGCLEAAKLSVEKGDYDEAIRIYREIAEVIQDNMENVDDSYAHYDTNLSIVLDKMVDCIKQQRLDHQQKRKHISYLHARATMDEYGCGARYSVAVSRLCSDREDHAYRRKLEKGTK